MSKVIFAGLESSGKSLQLAMQAEKIVLRNARWREQSGIVRPIYSNMIFSESFKAGAAELGIPLLEWENLDDLVKIANADVFIDEVGNYFDSRLWATLSLDARRWLTQGAKTGVHIYGSAQDFSQIDKSFRLLVTECHHVTKMIGSPRPMKTRPAVKRIWGICMMRSVNPRTFKGDDVTMETIGWPSFFTINREDCAIFDTSQRIVRSAPAPLKKIVRVCPEDGYRRVTYV